MRVSRKDLRAIAEEDVIGVKPHRPRPRIEATLMQPLPERALRLRSGAADCGGA